MLKKNLWVLMLTFSLQFLLNVQAKAQEQVIQVDSLYSQILQEQRLLHIVFPKNYNPASTNKVDQSFLKELNARCCRNWTSPALSFALAKSVREGKFFLK